MAAFECGGRTTSPITDELEGKTVGHFAGDRGLLQGSSMHRFVPQHLLIHALIGTKTTLNILTTSTFATSNPCRPTSSASSSSSPPPLKVTSSITHIGSIMVKFVCNPPRNFWKMMMTPSCQCPQSPQRTATPRPSYSHRPASLPLCLFAGHHDATLFSARTRGL